MRSANGGVGLHQGLRRRDVRVAVATLALMGAASVAAADTSIPKPKPPEEAAPAAPATPATINRGDERALLAAIRRYCRRFPGEEREAGTQAADCRAIESDIKDLESCRAGHREDCNHINDPLHWEMTRSVERRGAWHLKAYPNCWRWEIEALRRRGGWQLLSAEWGGGACD